MQFNPLEALGVHPKKRSLKTKPRGIGSPDITNKHIWFEPDTCMLVPQGTPGAIHLDSQLEYLTYVHLRTIYRQDEITVHPEIILCTFGDSDGGFNKATWVPDFRVGATIYEVKGNYIASPKFNSHLALLKLRRAICLGLLGLEVVLVSSDSFVVGGLKFIDWRQI